MGRKVFITTLGTSTYKKSVYEREEDGFVSEETRFIQLATMDYLSKKEALDWNDENCVFLVGLTEKADVENWNFIGKKDVYDSKLQKTNEEEYTGLKIEVKSKYPNLDIQECSIPEGRNEQEIYKIFVLLFEKINSGDELYFDLTHGFRYIPMLVLVLSNYARFLKDGITIKHISYGNFELKNAKGNCTLIDLLPLSALQDWTYAAGHYVNSGRTDKLEECNMANLRDLLRSDNDARNLRNYISYLAGYIDNLRTCRGLKIGQANVYKELVDKSQILNGKTNEIINPIIEKIKNDFVSFSSEDDLVNCLYAVQWCNNKKLFQQAYTFLEEYVISFFCIGHNLSNSLADRKKVTQAISFLHTEFANRKKAKKFGCPYTPNKIQVELSSLCRDELLLDKELLEKIKRLIDIRNDYNHCGIRGEGTSPMEAKKITKEVEELYNIIADSLTLYKLHDQSKENLLDASDIFVNLSNHPSSSWCDSQLMASKKYGAICDLKFPKIDSTIDEEGINKLVENIIADIQLLSNNWSCHVTVHIMGEMTFTYAMVQKLRMMGVTCVASTTERIVDIQPDGSKVVKFKFERFREYR